MNEQQELAKQSDLTVISKNLPSRSIGLIEKCLDAVEKEDYADLTPAHFESAMDLAGISWNFLHPEMTAAKAYADVISKTELGRTLYGGYRAAEIEMAKRQR